MRLWNFSKFCGIYIIVSCTTLAAVGEVDVMLIGCGLFSLTKVAGLLAQLDTGIHWLLKKVRKLLAVNQLPRIYSLHIRTDIQFRFATTLVTSRVDNKANYSQETVFDVILPEEAFISNFTLEIDGVVYPGIVKDQNKARKEYKKAKKKGQTTGIVSQERRDTRMFKVKITVAAFGKSTFNLTYQELLKRVKGAYEHRTFVTPGYPINDLQISVAIQESREITKLTVPPIKALNDLLLEREEFTENVLAVITRPTKRSTYISYAPSVEDQDAEGVSGQLIVHYDIERSLDGGDILVVNGYFVHFLAPDIKTSIPKDVLFILDASGSMIGRKLKQLKDAMYVILDELQERDRFNIIFFHTSYSDTYKQQMIDVTKKDILKAKKFIKSIYAEGGTDMNEAVLKGLKLLSISRQEVERSPVVVFLTDGHPSTGVTSDEKILSNIIFVNKGGDPHYMIRIRNMEHPICFDVQSKEGEIHNLITDSRNKITVNTQIISAGLNIHGESKTFIGEVAVQKSHHRIVITPDTILFDTKDFRWKEEALKHFGGHTFMLSDNGHLFTLLFEFGAEVLIRRHKGKETGVNYLNLYVKHEDGFSKMATGLIGQFVNGFKHIYLRKQILSNSGQTEARLLVKEGVRFLSAGNATNGDVKTQTRHRITAKLVERPEVVEKGYEMCWMVH